jgi:hypothetical protein
MSNLREQKPVLPCTLPVHDPSLAPEGFGERQGYARVPCYACGVQYDRREIEEHSHPNAIHVSRFVRGIPSTTSRPYEAVYPGSANLEP